MVSSVIKDNKDVKISNVVLNIRILKQIKDYLLKCPLKF
jgi:hypothetical protein